ncbi:TRAP transporter large permease subunit [Nonomuraea sp. SYSU D8015]|uniref:TRAP transporter large permease subunit n=1 Tax=Nonomuraea sp. SYSU D8015 TaxID=2593644 RepID=UPI001660A43F|nr:TRAP transporter large permease subunit [Nonomuraea sp. SYSU D8015]
MCLFGGADFFAPAWAGVTDALAQEVVFAALTFVFMGYLLTRLGLIQEQVTVLNSVFGRLRGAAGAASLGRRAVACVTSGAPCERDHRTRAASLGRRAVACVTSGAPCERDHQTIAAVGEVDPARTFGRLIGWFVVPTLVIGVPAQPSGSSPGAPVWSRGPCPRWAWR